MADFSLLTDGKENLLKKQLIDIFSIYKIPFIIAAIGLIFIASIGIILVKQQNEPPPDIVFSTKEDAPRASQSAETKNSMIQVDVAGAVLKPGVYAMEHGSRVVDALAKAGGLSASADRAWIDRTLNRAAKLTDGAKIFIPTVGQKVDSGGTTTVLGTSDVSKLISINTASADELDKLPGVGSTTVQKIISGRPYMTLEDLTKKKVLGPAAYEKVKNLISL